MFTPKSCCSSVPPTAHTNIAIQSFETITKNSGQQRILLVQASWWISCLETPYPACWAYWCYRSPLTTWRPTEHVTAELYYATFATFPHSPPAGSTEHVTAELYYATFLTLHLLGLLKMLQLNYGMLQSPHSTFWAYWTCYSWTIACYGPHSPPAGPTEPDVKSEKLISNRQIVLRGGQLRHFIVLSNSANIKIQLLH
jgi:hypothetical protein